MKSSPTTTKPEDFGFILMSRPKVDHQTVDEAKTTSKARDKSRSESRSVQVGA